MVAGPIPLDGVEVTDRQVCRPTVIGLGDLTGGSSLEQLILARLDDVADHRGQAL
jgi:hypothetical protein